MHNNLSTTDRVRNSLKTQFIADALAMPVHWHYTLWISKRPFPEAFSGSKPRQSSTPRPLCRCIPPAAAVASLVKRNLPDNQVVGRMYSPACYISDSWPVVLYLAYKYRNDPWLALRVNTNLGGDNVHRGMVLGALLGLISDDVAARWFDQLLDHEEIGRETAALISAAVSAATRPAPLRTHPHLNP